MQVEVSMYLLRAGLCLSPLGCPRSEADDWRISRPWMGMIDPQAVARGSAFSMRTRKVLYSGVHVFASPTVGVIRFASGPRWFSKPLYPQVMGKPMCQTDFPSTIIGRSRLVTIATPCTEPRAEVTRTCEPLVMPF